MGKGNLNMESRYLGEVPIEKKSKDAIRIMFIVASVIVTGFVLVIFSENKDRDFLVSFLTSIKFINSSLAIISIISCIVIYKKTKDSIIFAVSLIYLGLAISIITGQFDYYIFLSEESNKSSCMGISTTFLRLIIIYSIINTKSKIYNLINKYKGYSFIFVIIYSFVIGIMEQNLNINKSYFNKDLFVFYNIFIFSSYLLIVIKLFFSSIEEKKVMMGAFSISLFLFSIKSIYVIYTLNYNYFSIKLISVLITYSSFFVIVVGTVIELYLLHDKSEHLNEELEKFYNLVNYNSHTYMFICDNDLNISYMNNKIKESFSDKIDTIRFKEVLLKIDDVKENIPIILEELENKGTWRGVVKDIEMDRVVDCFIQLIHSSSGKNEILVSYIDISNNIRLESEIEIHKLNDIRKSEFISVLSHELKTPLNIFSSSVQLLDKAIYTDKNKFTDLYNKHSRSLKLNCKRMLRIINNIIDTTKIDSGVLKPMFGNYEIVSIIEDITLSTVAFAEAKNIRIQFDTNVEEHYIKCDPTMIEKIILNLVSNAIKYSNEGGLIRIDFILRDNIVKLRVRDNGIGIPNELKEKIFDRFIRIDSSLKRLNEGSGIGLSIVRSMVKIHEGNIFVDSMLGRGSVFEVQLPNKIIESEELLVYEFDGINTELELSDIY